MLPQPRAPRAPVWERAAAAAARAAAAHYVALALGALGAFLLWHDFNTHAAVAAQNYAHDLHVYAMLCVDRQTARRIGSVRGVDCDTLAHAANDGYVPYVVSTYLEGAAARALGAAHALVAYVLHVGWWTMLPLAGVLVAGAMFLGALARVGCQRAPRRAMFRAPRALPIAARDTPFVVDERGEQLALLAPDAPDYAR